MQRMLARDVVFAVAGIAITVIAYLAVASTISLLIAVIIVMTRFWLRILGAL